MPANDPNLPYLRRVAVALGDLRGSLGKYDATQRQYPTYQVVQRQLFMQHHGGNQRGD